jgi:hypothetical protein
MNTQETTQKYTETLHSITIRDFVQLWRKAFADKRTKPSIVQHQYGDLIYKTKEKGWIYPEHHILYNLVRNLPVTRGFQPDSDGYKNALHHLIHLQSSQIEKILFKPFEDSLDFEKFQTILTEIRQYLKK